MHAGCRAVTTSSISLRMTRICAWLFGVATLLYLFGLITVEDWNAVLAKIVAIVIAAIST